MQISRYGNTALATGVAYTRNGTLYYVSFIATEQIGNALRSDILLERPIELRIPGQIHRNLYPAKPYKSVTRALPRSIYNHYVILSDDDNLALLVDPAHPAPADPYNHDEDGENRDRARLLARKNQKPDFLRLAAQVVNATVDVPVLPEWIEPILARSPALASELECSGDALHGLHVRSSKEWAATVRSLLQRGQLPWPQPPIIVNTPTNLKEIAHAPAGTGQSRLLPNPA